MTKGITRRWLFNSLGVILLVVITLIVSLSFVVQGYVYNGIQQAINGRSGELMNVFAGYGNKTMHEFSTAARSYVENSPNKESMEMMVFNSEGNIIISSTGFEPDASQPKPDYTLAFNSSDNYGTWTGNLTSGEKAMAVTRVMRNNSGSFMGAVRYVVSLEEADKQIVTVVGALMVAGLFSNNVIKHEYFYNTKINKKVDVGQ